MGLVTASAASAASAHGFGQRFDLPLPLWLWVTGAGSTIVLTFLLMAVFVKERRSSIDYPRLDLLQFRPVQWAADVRTVATVRLLAVLLFALTVCTGLIGNQDPYSNLIPTMVWVIWWVGVAFVCALIGDLWMLINPWRTLFAWAEAAYGALTRGRALSLGLEYPTWLAAWPAVLVLLAFGWAELIWGDRNVPSRLALALAGYSLFTWLGMFAFGRTTWLVNAEAFSVAFGVLARFAPTEFVPPFQGEPRGRLNLRPSGAGLLAARPVSWSFMAFVILMLATVTFDGFQETALMQKIDTVAESSHEVASLLFDLSELGLDESRVTHTLTLVAFAVAFLAVFWVTNWISLRWGTGPGRQPSAIELSAGVTACSFVLTLVPIAVAYHLSHYFSLLLTAGQFVIPLSSDPFGWGWNLFGTAGYKVNLAIVSPTVFWYSAVAIILLGHVIAVYLAHGVALRLFGGQAFIREIPMVLLMVAYTMLSLWILAQPIVG
ncbi:MAG TPA: hypothetical protein VGM15_07440 [Burkholderiaceae bacterium]